MPEPDRFYHDAEGRPVVETRFRVRYFETDAMRIVHHAVYPVWMELGRSDLLRQLGQSYAEWEKRGVMMSVAELRQVSRDLQLEAAGERKEVLVDLILQRQTERAGLE